MRITHNMAAPAGAAQAEPLPFQDAEIRAGEMMGVCIRSAINPEGGREIPVSLELGMQISQLISDYIFEQIQELARKIEDNEARQAMQAEKGGQTV